jgi:branched-chain amino acid aminotransferase
MSRGYPREEPERPGAIRDSRPDAVESVYLNGELLPAADATIPVLDRAVLFGDSAFETLRAYGGRPFRLRGHLERLADTCRVLRMPMPEDPEKIAAAVIALLGRNDLADGTGRDARVRITVTGGPPGGPKGLSRPGPTGIFITAQPLEPLPERFYREGIALAISGIKRNSSSPLSSVKSGNYLDSLFARQEADDRGAADAVMLTTAGNLAEASSSNLFMVKGPEAQTPDIGCGFLPGITREAVIELCGVLSIECRPVMAGPEALLDADEAFLTNSLIELLPVRKVGDRVIGGSCPGPLTTRLAAAYQELVSRELGLLR